MKKKTVEELLIPLSEYATVSQDVTLKEAIEALKKALFLAERLWGY